MICSICNQFQAVPIIYGYPSPELIEASREDKIVLGGCTVKKYTHYCLYCNETLVADGDLEF